MAKRTQSERSLSRCNDTFNVERSRSFQFFTEENMSPPKSPLGTRGLQGPDYPETRPRVPGERRQKSRCFRLFADTAFW